MKKKAMRRRIRSLERSLVLAKLLPTPTWVRVLIYLGPTEGGPDYLEVPVLVDDPREISLPALGFVVRRVEE